MSFRTDLKQSIEVEEAFVKVLKSQGLKAGRNTSKTLYEQRLYDIWSNEGNLFEIKYDRLAEKTGNVYFEDASLLRSKSDYIVYKLQGTDSFWYLPKSELISFLSNPLHKKTSGGDQNAKGTLALLDVFKEHFTVWPPAQT